MGPEFAHEIFSHSGKNTGIQIQTMFVGKHLDTEIEHCRMIMVPCRARGYWCLYVTIEADTRPGSLVHQPEAGGAADIALCIHRCAAPRIKLLERTTV